MWSKLGISLIMKCYINYPLLVTGYDFPNRLLGKKKIKKKREKKAAGKRLFTVHMRQTTCADNDT